MSDLIKDFLQPISSWMFDNDKRIFESYDNVFFLVGIVVALVGSTAFLYKIIVKKIIYQFHCLSKYLVFYLVAVEI